MIFVECYPDFALVKSVTHYSKKEIVHVGGRGKVCTRLERTKNCKGMIDEDPWSVSHPYMKKLTKKGNFSKYGIKAFYDNENQNCLIVLMPRLEEWLLRVAKEESIDIKGYDLPENPDDLHDIININLIHVEKLINDMKGTTRVKKLKELLENNKIFNR